MERAYFASGCFWCVEEIFESVIGVAEVISGYAGGAASTANYSKVSAGVTRHAEAVEVIYDADKITYEQLLDVFFGSHDPTTLNQQGPDKGAQYRSAIFYTTETEQKLASMFIENLTNQKKFNGSITTEVSALDNFYPAEDYHQDYVQRNPNNGYVRNVSLPRFQRFKLQYKHLLKESTH